MGPKAATKPSGKSASTNSKAPAVKKEKKVISTDERIRRYFNSLCAQIDASHFKNAVKTCDKSTFIPFDRTWAHLTCRLVLRLEPSDKDAFQAKLFLLLQTEEYKQAIAMIQSSPEANKYEYEMAYSLYRMHEEKQARDVLEKLKRAGRDQERGVMHLEAQLVSPLFWRVYMYIPFDTTDRTTEEDPTK